MPDVMFEAAIFGVPVRETEGVVVGFVTDKVRPDALLLAPTLVTEPDPLPPGAWSVQFHWEPVA